MRRRIPGLALLALLLFPLSRGGIQASVPLVAALRVIYRRSLSPPMAASLRGDFADCPETRGEVSVVA